MEDLIMNWVTNMNFKMQKYTGLTADELFRLIVCVFFDIAEYVFPILLMPIVGDVLDIAGLGLGVALFGGYGLISILEFLPWVDFSPVFILIWLFWYYMKKQKERRKNEEFN